MKELLIYRHAKADKLSPGELDRERKLSGKGRRQAKRMGKVLRLANLLPDIALSSDAVRAVTTAELTLAAAGCAAAIQQRVMVVGHNPVLEELLERLTGDRVELKTGYLVRGRVDIARWKELSFESPFAVAEILVPGR